VSECLDVCKQHATHAMQVFLGTVMAAVLVVGGLFWWARHVRDDLADARAELSSLTIKLKHKPVIVHFRGKDYVRVVADSETSFTRRDGSEMGGRYAPVWHVR